MSRHASNKTQTDLLDDELGRCGSTGFQGRTSFPLNIEPPKVFAESLTTARRRRPLEPWRTNGEKANPPLFKIAPGLVEFQEVTMEKAPLREMKPRPFVKGTRIALEIIVSWKIDEMRYRHVSGPRIRYFKNGLYAVQGARIREFSPKEAYPIVLLHRVESNIESDMVQPEELLFLLATFGEDGAIAHESYNQSHYLPGGMMTFMPV